LREKRQDFVACCVVQRVERLSTGEKAFGCNAFGHNDFMGVERDVNISHNASLNAADRLIVDKRLCRGQNLIRATVHFHAPSIQHHAVLR
jgi:hemin uptake protein HemP